MNEFTIAKEKILEEMNIDLKLGLDKKRVEESKIKNGVNEFEKQKQISIGEKIIEAIKEPMLIMLIIAGIIAFVVNTILYLRGDHADFLECVGIFFAIVLSIFITIIIEGKSKKAFEALTRIGDDAKIRVIRDGKTQFISQQEIVVGDVVLIGIGDKIYADGRLVESNGLTVNESPLTGESVTVEKDSQLVISNVKTPIAQRKNMVYGGCFVTEGDGIVVITEVGEKTEFGKIAKELSISRNTTTPLQEKLKVLGKNITIIGSAASALVFLIQVIGFLINGTASLEKISSAFITSIVLIVASVPEGLPTIVAVSLAVNVMKMTKESALVKKMIASETIGCIDVICSDKTGTLTENKMTVTDVYIGTTTFKSSEIVDKNIINNFCINGTSDVNFENNKIEFIGNPTECALIVAANKSGINYKEIREKVRKVHMFPFSSETKSMTTIIEENEVYTAYAKGSPEKILNMCNINLKEKNIIENKIKEFQEMSRRVIAFSHKELSEELSIDRNAIKIQENMIFDGFVSISDPIRKDVYEAVKKCENANINIKMLTGDNLITAKAIAKELDILKDDTLAMEAIEIEELSDEELKKILPKISVIARSTPETKMRVVNMLKKIGSVVAVTGDGINDAPAIKNADVGIAMGISGTEVSKEASDIVLLNDSFSTIVKAVHWGRGIYENFQRFIQFQLTVNLSSVIVVMLSILFGIGVPFTALQLLWINIIMDGPPAIALGIEPVRDDLMNKKPIKRNSNIISKNMLSRITINGIYISIIFMLEQVFDFIGGTKLQKPTILFTLFVVFQLFNAMNSRELNNKSIFKNLIKNKWMIITFTITFLLQIIITEFGGGLFKTVPLSLFIWIKIILLGFTVIVVSEISNFIKNMLCKKV